MGIQTINMSLYVDLLMHPSLPMHRNILICGFFDAFLIGICRFVDMFATGSVQTVLTI